MNISVFQWILAIFMAVPVWIVFFTCKKEVVNKNIFKKYKHKPAIFVFWHGRSMMLSPFVCLGGGKSYAIASAHKDGRIMAKLQHLFGLRAIYGSSSHGGISVLRNGVRILRRGDHSLCMSPDGPGGPSLRVQDGALYFAKMTGAPIIPVCFSTNHAWFQNRWDRYLLAFPFSRIKIEIGEPFFVDSDISSSDFEIKKSEIESIMVEQLRRLDSEFNLYVVEQDLTARSFKQARRQGCEPKLMKKYRE